MKKVKRMMFGGISKGVASAAQKAAAAPKMKALGLGEGIARAAGVPVGTTVNAPARIAPIGGGAPAQGPSGIMGGIGNAVRSAVVGQKASQIAGKLGSMARPMFRKKGGKVSSASKRADGVATKGKTKGKMV